MDDDKTISPRLRRGIIYNRHADGKMDGVMVRTESCFPLRDSFCRQNVSMKIFHIPLMTKTPIKGIPAIILIVQNSQFGQEMHASVV